jgi:hypothetical protein
MRYGNDYDRGYRRSRPAGYDAQYGRPRGYDRAAGYDTGWGMTGLYRHMMRGRRQEQPEWARPISREEARGGDRWRSWDAPRGTGGGRQARPGLGVGRWGYDRY